MVAPGDVTEAVETQEILPGFSTIKDFTKAGFQAVMEATRFANNLPSGHSWDIYSASPSFQRIMDEQGKRILQIMNMVLRHQGIRGNIIMRDMEEKFDLLVDCNDTILERVGCNLDELSGITRNPVPVLIESTGHSSKVVSGSWNRNITNTPIRNSSSPKPTAKVQAPTVKLLTARNIERPQIKFKDKIDNSSSPFEPRIKEKPNALRPLAILVETAEEGECFSHPYEYELDLFNPPTSQLTQVTPQMFLPLDETPLILISKPEGIPYLLEDLKKCTEISIDLEHHSYRSFQGFTCLMQISTRKKDYIIDTLELRDKLEALNEIFTDPKIVKVFHGAQCDIEWLQRDLCLYVVNMFDTHQAARVLNFSHLSLAHLLKHYCNVTVDKQYQLADWRMRPLPPGLITYAREDTHYLLYIYDMMKNTLIEKANGQKNLLMAVIDQSRNLCKRRYVKPLYDEDSYKVLLRKNKKMFDNRQLYAFKELYRWRDEVARREDESTGYILPNHMLFSVAESLPREVQGILALCNPIPPLLRQNLLAVHHIIMKAREQSVIRPVLEEEARMRPMAQMVWNKIDLESPLYCPHDTTHAQDFREDLPTLLKPQTPAGTPARQSADPVASTKLLCVEPTLAIFDSETEDDDDEEITGATVPAGKALFVSPYERYKHVRPFMDAQAREEAEKKQQEEEEQQRKREQALIHGNTPNKEPEPEPVTRPMKHLLGKRKHEREEESLLRTPVSVKSEQKTESGTSTQTTTPLKTKKKKITVSDVPSTSSETPIKKKKKQFDSSASSTKNGSNKKDKQKLTTPADSPNDCQPFDYSKVDFRRFQGGSKKAAVKRKHEDQGIKPKGKKKKFIGKTNNKSFTYKR